MTLSPARATGWTVAGLAFAYVQSNIVAELLISGSILVSVIFLTRKFKSLVTFWGLSVPFLVPLILLHGFVNPNFTADDSVLGLPFRHSGMNFAISVYSDLAIFFSVAIAWMNVNRDHAFDWLASRPLPTTLLAILFQAISISVLVGKRAQSVHRAQMARGLAVGPGFVRRLRAFPSVILPVVTSLINEAEHRSTTLWTRGFARTDFAVRKIPLGSARDALWIVAPFTVLVFLLI